MPEGREEIVALLALERAEGIGHERLRRLLAHFGSARAALEASDWAAAVGRGGPWRRPGRDEFAWAEAQWERCDAEGGRCLAPVDADYPELLRHIPAPPPLLFALGPDDLAGPTVAIVGPRKASEYGLQVAGELAQAGADIVFAVGGRGDGESGGGCVGEREQVQFTQGILHTRTWTGPHGQIRCPPCILY